MNAVPNFQNQTVGEAQRVCVKSLKTAGLDAPVLEARLLLALVLGGGPERVLSARDEPLTSDQAERLADAIERRSNREPLSHITGAREFWSLPFIVTPATLTPRPDTETLIEAVLDHGVGGDVRILDLGTGTGCILLALLHEWPEAQGTGVDASAEALAIARDNAAALNLGGRAHMVEGDWTQPGWERNLNAPFDVVVCNPPYIPSGDIDGLERDVKEYEPLRALDGGMDGLDAYRAIIRQLRKLLKPQGLVAFEVGIGQAGEVANLLQDAGLAILEQRADLGGALRVVVAQCP